MTVTMNVSLSHVQVTGGLIRLPGASHGATLSRRTVLPVALPGGLLGPSFVYSCSYYAPGPTACEPLSTAAARAPWRWLPPITPAFEASSLNLQPLS